LQGATSSLEKTSAKRFRAAADLADNVDVSESSGAGSMHRLTAFLNSTHQSTLLLQSADRRLASEAALSEVALHKAQDTVKTVAAQRSQHLAFMTQLAKQLQQILGKVSSEGEAEREQAQQEMRTAELLQNALRGLEQVQQSSLLQGGADSKTLQAALEAAFEALAASATETAERAESSAALEETLKQVLTGAGTVLDSDAAQQKKLDEAVSEVRQAQVIQEKERSGQSDSGRSLVEEALTHSQAAENYGAEGATNVAAVGQAAAEMTQKNQHLEHELQVAKQKNQQLSDYLQSLAQYVQGAAHLVQATQLADNDQVADDTGMVQQPLE